MIGKTLNEFFKNGNINLKQISIFLNCSNSYASTIVKEIMVVVNDSIEVKLAWNTLIHSNILLVDETFIKINGRVWYLVVAINEDRYVRYNFLKK